MIECGLDLSALLVEFRKLGDLSQWNGRMDVLSIGLKQPDNSLPSMDFNIDLFRDVPLVLRPSILTRRESCYVKHGEYCGIVLRF